MSSELLVFEGASFLFSTLVTFHALRRGREGALKVVSLAIFGFGLEFLSIPFTGAYHYGDFTFMLGPLPICIGLFWMSIIYSAMETTDRLLRKARARPFLDALLALNIDLTMDAVATRAGFWHWGIDGQWFGVPYANFFGWFNFVFAYSAISRAIGWYLSKKGLERLKVFTWPLAIVPALGAVLLSNSVMGLEMSVPLQEALLISLIAASVIIVLLHLWVQTPRMRKKADWYPMATPLFLHLFFLLLIMRHEMYRTVPMLLAMSLSMLAISLVVHVLAERASGKRGGQGRRLPCQ
jgi:uncharacterized membrane protein